MALTSVRTYAVRGATGATASTAIALVAATVKSVVSVLAPATTPIGLERVTLSFNSVTGTDIPALVEIGITTTLGTVTAMTPNQLTGHTLATSASAGYNATAEPTYNRIISSFFVPVYMGLLDYTWPLGFEPQADSSQGFAVRVTSPSAASCHANLIYSE